MASSVKDIIAFVRENDVKFIRMAFCDVLGTLKNISVISDRFEEAVLNGLSFDGSSIDGFSDDSGVDDLLLYPDPSTLSVMPWRPSQGKVIRFLCDIKHADGSQFVCDSRFALKEAIARLKQFGLSSKIGEACEFYLFKTDENGMPTKITLDNGGYCDIAPLDRGENVRREICLNLEEMGFAPERSLHERGPGQNEIDFKYNDALAAADNFLNFKSVVKAIANINGLYASFMPKPLPDKSGNGLKIGLSLYRGDKNLFDGFSKSPCEEAKSFIAGVMAHIAEITAFLNPVANSYERLGSCEAPKYVSWSPLNRFQLIRVPSVTGERARFELRSPDPAINPYLAFALILHAGLDGIENGMALADPINVNLNAAPEQLTKSIEKLPESLDEAVALAENSELIKKVIPSALRSRYLSLKKAEASEYLTCGNKAQFCDERYFRAI